MNNHSIHNGIAHSPSSIPRYSPTRTVVTSFTPRSSVTRDDGGDWVLALAANSPTISCGLSNGKLQVYDENSLLLVSSHDVTNSIITDIQYASPHEIYMTTREGAFLACDVRSPGTSTTSMMTNQNNHAFLRRQLLPDNDRSSALSIAIGYEGTVAAVTTDKSRIHFYDVRKPNAILGSYVDAHTGAIECAKFQNRSLLVSGGEDGLVNAFDTTQPTEAQALQAVINVGAPIRKLGMYSQSCVYVLTGSETCSLWDLEKMQCLQNWKDLRTQLTTSNSHASCQYLIDAEVIQDQLLLAAGDSVGNVAIFQHDHHAKWNPTCDLLDGHTTVVRGWCRISENTFFTAGEDARLCEWKTSPIPTRSTAFSTSPVTVDDNRPSNKRPFAGAYEDGTSFRRQKSRNTWGLE